MYTVKYFPKALWSLYIIEFYNSHEEFFKYETAPFPSHMQESAVVRI